RWLRRYRCRSTSSRGLLEVGGEVVFGDASAGAGAGDVGEVDVVLASHLADEGGEGSGGLGRGGRLGGWGWRRRCRCGCGWCGRRGGRRRWGSLRSWGGFLFGRRC